jgi:hypothetical protein
VDPLRGFPEHLSDLDAALTEVGPKMVAEALAQPRARTRRSGVTVPEEAFHAPRHLHKLTGMDDAWVAPHRQDKNVTVLDNVLDAPAAWLCVE